MDIILDSSILYSNWFLDTNNFKSIFSYLRFTNSKLLLPEIVIDETIGNYKKEIEIIVAKQKKTNSLIEKLRLKPEPELDIEKNIKNYKDFLYKTLPKELPVGIVPYEPEHYKSVIRRAIDRKKPCCPNGEQIRDAGIWLSVISFCKKNKNPIVFIADDKAFYNAETNQLHDELAQEVKNENIKLTYYRNIDNFMHSEFFPEKDLDINWIQERFPEPEIVSFVKNELLPKYEDKIFEWLEDGYYSDDYPERVKLNYIEGFLEDIGTASILKASILETQSMQPKINIVVDLVLELEFCVKEYEGCDDWSSSTETKEIEVRAVISFLIDNNKLISHELENWYLPQLSSEVVPGPSGGYAILRKCSWSSEAERLIKQL